MTASLWGQHDWQSYAALSCVAISVAYLLLRARKRNGAARCGSCASCSESKDSGGDQSQLVALTPPKPPKPGG